jgi:hypothetical protein
LPRGRAAFLVEHPICGLFFTDVSELAADHIGAAPPFPVAKDGLIY